MQKKIAFSLSVLAGVLATASGWAQQTEPPQQVQQSPQTGSLTLHVQVNEVVLPVTVRDKKGALMNSLKKSDFTLTEDGRPQTIKSFTQQSNLPFLVGLLLDTSRSMESARNDVRSAAGKFVDQMIPGTPAPGAGSGAGSGAESGVSPVPPNQAFLLHFDREVELLVDFTSKPGEIHKELDDLGPTRSASRTQSQGPETSDSDQENGGSSRTSHTNGSRGGTALYDAIYLAADDVMKSQSGRKALIVFSDGVDRGSKESLNDAIDAADHANLSIYTIYFKGEEERQNNGFPSNGGGHHGGGYPGGGGGGGGYPGGGGGGYPGGGGHHGGSGEPKPSVDGKKIMEQLANRTGGHYFEAKKKDNLNDIYAQIGEELRSQYLLTYTPDKPDPDGGYHKIILKTNDDNLKVFTREGYFAPTK
jgi:VWFA-related protein